MLSADEAGTCIIWCTLQGVAMQAVPLTASITSLCFGGSGYCMAATSSFSQVIYFEQPSANDLVGLWLDDSRPIPLAQDLTKQLLQTYPNACNLKAQFSSSTRCNCFSLHVPFYSWRNLCHSSCSAHVLSMRSRSYHASRND